MNKTGPVVIIEDDIDDQQILETIFQKLNYENEVVFFADGEKALAYIAREDVMPFLILSDINMPRLNGMELKMKIHTDAELQKKCIPYLFFTTSASKKAVMDAYSMSAQVFFIKETAMEDISLTIRAIMEYWRRCYSPSHF